jgi:hypothetical protein
MGTRESQLKEILEFNYVLLNFFASDIYIYTTVHVQDGAGWSGGGSASSPHCRA